MPQSMTTDKKPVPSANPSGQAAPALLFPFLDLKAQHVSIREEVLEAVHRVLESQHFILGAEVEGLEKEVAKLANCEFAVGCASGSDARLGYAYASTGSAVRYVVYAEDRDLLIRLRENEVGIEVLPEVVLLRRYHGENMTAPANRPDVHPLTRSLKGKLDRERARRERSG